MEAEPGDLVVVRLWSWGVERLRLDAERDYAAQAARGDPNPLYSISAWGQVVLPGQDVEDVVQELFRYVRTQRRAKWAAVTSDARLRHEGFKIVLSEPPAGHYDVVLGTDIATADFAGLAAVFNEHERRKFQ